MRNFNSATHTMQHCADEAVQTLSGAEEIMKDLAARQLSWQ